MSSNNKIGAKCLNNLHLKLNYKRILEDTIEVMNIDSENEKDEEEKEEKEEKEKDEEDQKAENKDRD